MKKKVNAEEASKARVPVVNWGLLGEENYVTDYVQVDNPALKRIAKGFPNELEGAVKAVARFVAGHVEYPLNHRGRPTATRNVKVFRWWNGFYLADREDDYGWLFPNQTVALAKPHGICFDSSVLACSLLRIKVKIVLR